MTTTITEHTRHHWGWQRRRGRGREGPGRTAAAHEAAAAVEAEARWLDDGGAAEEGRDRMSVRGDC